MSKLTNVIMAASLGLATAAGAQTEERPDIDTEALTYSGTENLVNFVPRSSTDAIMPATSSIVAKFQDRAGNPHYMRCDEIEMNRAIVKADKEPKFSAMLEKANDDLACTTEEPSVSADSEALAAEKVENALMDQIADKLVPFKFVTLLPDYSITVTMQQPGQNTGEMNMPGLSQSMRQFHIIALFMNAAEGTMQGLDCDQLKGGMQATLIEGVKEPSAMGKKLYQKQYEQFQAGAAALQCPTGPSV